jgi:hypothetical protein
MKHPIQSLTDKILDQTIDVRDLAKSTCVYDYTNQAWLVDGRYEKCGHRKPSDGPACECYGRIHEGKTPEEVAAGRQPNV